MDLKQEYDEMFYAISKLHEMCEKRGELNDPCRTCLFVSAKGYCELMNTVPADYDKEKYKNKMSKGRMKTYERK